MPPLLLFPFQIKLKKEKKKRGGGVLPLETLTRLTNFIFCLFGEERFGGCGCSTKYRRSNVIHPQNKMSLKGKPTAWKGGGPTPGALGAQLFCRTLGNTAAKPPRR